MCGACAGAPQDWTADLIRGTRQRSEVAERLSTLVRHGSVRYSFSGWTVSGPTGATTLCRTFDQLVDAVVILSGLSHSKVREKGLPAHHSQ